jgi:GNAT superfamily N-acetyltransferase
LDGVDAGVFPAGAEREIYNNAVLGRGLDLDAQTAAVDAMERAYGAADVDRYAAWVHETEDGLRAELDRRGYGFAEATRSMAMPLDQLAPGPVAAAGFDLGPVTWAEYRTYLHGFGVPAGLLAGTSPRAFDAVGARRSDRLVATALAFDHDGDCGVFNVSTLEGWRGLGVGTAITHLLLLRARERGCTTATLQSTPMAERVYAGLGFRDLGRFLELQPAQR